VAFGQSVTPAQPQPQQTSFGSTSSSFGFTATPPAATQSSVSFFGNAVGGTHNSSSDGGGFFIGKTPAASSKAASKREESESDEESDEDEALITSLASLSTQHHEPPQQQPPSPYNYGFPTMGGSPVRGADKQSYGIPSPFASASPITSAAVQHSYGIPTSPQRDSRPKQPEFRPAAASPYRPSSLSATAALPAPATSFVTSSSQLSEAVEQSLKQGTPPRVRCCVRRISKRFGLFCATRAVFSSGKPPQSRMAKLLLLVSMLFKAQRITAQEKSALKDLVIQDHESLVCALEAFETEKDFDELEDTLHRICQSTPPPPPQPTNPTALVADVVVFFSSLQ
jgi:hypothetical protein